MKILPPNITSGDWLESHGDIVATQGNGAIRFVGSTQVDGEPYPTITLRQVADARLMAASKRMAEALLLRLATDIPFQPVEEGGLGLEPTTENLHYDAYKARSEKAMAAMRAALEEAGYLL